MRTKLGILAAGFGFVCMTTAALAHHGFDTEYDANKKLTLSGVVQKVEWQNPHMRVYVDCKDSKGVVTTWNLELGSPNSVIRRGWKPSDLKLGAKISFKGFGGRKVLTRAAADVLTLADGRSFTGASGAPDGSQQYGFSPGSPNP